MKKTIKQLLAGLGFVTMLTMLTITGCGMQDGSNPLSVNDTAITAEDGATGVLTKKNKNKSNDTSESTSNTTQDQTAPTANPSPKTLTQVISAEYGGYMSIKTDDNGFKYNLTFPAGALDEDTKITLIVPDQGKSMVLLEPHGIQFNKPVKLKMEIYVERVATLSPNTDGNGNAKLGIYYHNEASNVWEYQKSENEIEKKKKKIKSETELNHFSRYALGGDNPIQKWGYQYGYSGYGGYGGYSSYSPYSPY